MPLAAIRAQETTALSYQPRIQDCGPGPANSLQSVSFFVRQCAPQTRKGAHHLDVVTEMLVPLAVAARFRPARNSKFKPESRTNRKNEPILQESLVGPPPRGAGLLRSVSFAINLWCESLSMLARPRGVKRLDCKCHVRRRVSL